jgi:glycosyltransferase involved in cell wall biosynthesis
MIDPPKQLAIFVPAMYGGGAERAMLKLARGIAARGYVTDLVLARAEGPYLAEVPESVRVVDLKASRVLTSLPALVHYLRRERPEAMLCALGHANIIALWARRLAGVPTRVVVSVRNTSPSVQHTPTRRGRLMPQLSRRFYPWADGIVAVSKGVADDLARMTGLPRQRIQVIYNPIVTPELRAKAQVPLEHPWFRPGEPPVILAVGRLTAQKDFPTLIQAFARVRQARPAWLLILGEGEERSALEALVRQLGLEQDVSLPGFVANPYPYMARASLFVLSSRWEGLPGVLIEALYCGAPLISTDCPSGPREILADGQYGQLVPVGDATALARAIETSLESETPRPPPESWHPFEMEAVVSKYINILLESQ